MKPSQNNNIRPPNEKYDANIGPPLPTRRPQKGDLVPVSPPLIESSNNSHSSVESLASYDDIKELSKAPEPEPSSDDDEDATYEAFVHVKQKITKMSTPFADDTTESKNEASTFGVKNKIEKYQASTIKERVSADLETIPRLNNKNVNMFFQECNKVPNTPPNMSPDVESKHDVDKVSTDGCEKTSDPKIFKGAIALKPPVIKKVPTVPLKPKVRDKPSIGKRPPFGSFKQITGDR